MLYKDSVYIAHRTLLAVSECFVGNKWLSGQNAMFFCVKPGAMYGNHKALNGWIQDQSVWDLWWTSFSSSISLFFVTIIPPLLYANLSVTDTTQS